MKFISNIQEVFSPDAVERDFDEGSLVETVLITAGLAIPCLLFVNWVGTALTNKAAEVADCIEGSSTYTSSSSAKNCKETKAKHSDKNSFKKDEGYKGRFG